MRHFGNKLDEILADKKVEVESLLPQAAALERAASRRDDFRSFFGVLGGGMRDQEIDEGYGSSPLAVIAEIKRASPSAGLICEDFDPVAIAVDYERAGADALSVLTDRNYFQGDLGYLADIREEVDLPLLRKDFILHEVQINVAAAAGADAILLIVAALDQKQLVKLLDVAHDLSLDVLVEVHDLEEMDRALDTDARIIGINNRNLRSFEVSLQTTETLSEEVGSDCILVSESGIHSGREAAKVKAWGSDAILVGESLMRSEDRAQLIQHFKFGY